MYFDLLPIALYRDKLSQPITPEVKDVLNDLTIHPNLLSEEMYLLDREEFKSVKEEIYTHIRKYEKDILGFTGNLKLRITESWYRETVPDNNHGSHVHANSLLSGVVYVQIPKQPLDVEVPHEDGLGHEGINFVHRESHGVFKDFKFQYQQEDTKYNAKNSFLKVEDNDIVLFPSHLEHFVSYNQSKENVSRKIISFNTFIEGDINLNNTWPSRLILNSESDYTHVVDPYKVNRKWGSTESSTEEKSEKSVTSRKIESDDIPNMNSSGVSHSDDIPNIDLPEGIKDVHSILNYIDNRM